MEESKSFDPPTTNDTGQDKIKGKKAAIMAMMIVMEVKASRMVVKALRNTLDCKVAALVDTYALLLLLPSLLLVRRIA